MLLTQCLSSQNACANYFYTLNGNLATTTMTNLFTGNCSKGYNYYDKSQLSNQTAIKGSVPFASSGSNYPSTPVMSTISVDTSSYSNYSDFTFIYKINVFNNFKRIDMKNNFRFYFRIYYDFETQPTKNRINFSKQYSNPIAENKISATISLTNGLTQTVNSELQLPVVVSNQSLSI